MYTENQVSVKNPVNQGQDCCLQSVELGSSGSSMLLKINTCMAMKDSKPALLYELLNLIFNRSNCNCVKLIK